MLDILGWLLLLLFIIYDWLSTYPQKQSTKPSFSMIIQECFHECSRVLITKQNKQLDYIGLIIIYYLLTLDISSKTINQAVVSYEHTWIFSWMFESLFRDHLSPTTRTAAKNASRIAFRNERRIKYTVMRRVYFLLKNRQNSYTALFSASSQKTAELNKNALFIP